MDCGACDRPSDRFHCESCVRLRVAKLSNYWSVLRGLIQTKKAGFNAILHSESSRMYRGNLAEAVETKRKSVLWCTFQAEIRTELQQSRRI